MRDHPSHRDDESPWRELAIVARVLIEKTKQLINDSRRDDPERKLFILDKFEPDIHDFENAFEPYVRRIRLRERLDVLRKYEHYGTIAEQFQVVAELNELNFEIAKRENPDEPVR